MAKRTRNPRPRPAAPAAAPPSSTVAATPSSETPASSPSSASPSSASPNAPTASASASAPQSEPGTRARRDDARAAFPAIGKVARPRFWHDFEIPWAKWVVFRFVFFGLHAVDAFLQIVHAPRYGAGGFNVQQLPGAPLPDPSRVGLVFIYGALSILFALIAQGIAIRWLLPIATALYGYAYFVSQLDSYQHHYLMWLVLLLLCFVPARPDAAPRGARVAWQRSWALRLVLVQLAVVYLWAAIAKIDPVWLDGTALTRQVSTDWIKPLVAAVGYRSAAVIVLVVELTLAVTIWNRILWPLALALGVGLHLGIELVGLDIGLFSFFMLALYLLVVPDSVYPWLWRHLARLGSAAARIPVTARLAVAAVVVCIALFIIFRHPLPLRSVGALAMVVTAVLTASARGAGRAALARRVAQTALALAPLAILLSATDVANDHFRMWAGASRRMGLAADERAAYDGLLRVDPTSEYAHYYLGQLERTAQRPDAAIAHFRAAQTSEPTRGRSYLAEAFAQLDAGRPADAIDALERGLVHDPSNSELRAKLTTLRTAAPAEAPSGP